MSTTKFEEEPFDDPSDFSSNQLSALDELLRCPICKEIFNATMLLSTCSHSFCALCIRRSLSAEQICPKCRKPAFENNLIHNYDLDNVVDAWRQSRQFMVEMERVATSRSEQNENMQTTNSECDSGDDFMPTSNVKSICDVSSSSSRRSTRLSSQAASPAAKLESTSVVECPICAKHMQYNVLDLHIDSCLNGDSSVPPSPAVPSSSTNTLASASSSFPFNSSSSSSKTKQKPIDLGKKPIKQVYALMRDKELTELLRSFNLPEGGNRAKKIWRHKEYINLYNANYDSQNPVSAPVLVQRLQAIENSQATEKHNKSKRKATDPNQHKAKYADQFQSLIDNVKKKKVTDQDSTPKKQ